MRSLQVCGAVAVLASLGLSVSARAYNLGRLYERGPELTRVVRQAPEQVERCIVLADHIGPPSVYRMPGGAVLIHGGSERKADFAYEVRAEGEGTRLTVYEGSRRIGSIEHCLAGG